MSRPRPTRLTHAEWDAIVAALVALDGDRMDLIDAGDQEALRENRAATRALNKIRDTLTTPAIRRGRTTPS